MTSFENYINTDPEKDKYIYRIISLERLKELFSTKQNTLVSPGLWDDPFENFIMNSRLKTSAGEVGDLNFSGDFYGQCWTLHKASDAMWRIYSSDKCGIRIRTTIKKLAGSLHSGLGEWKNEQCYIGRVQYLSAKKLTKFAKESLSTQANMKKIASTLLVKRPAFAHENEVRLLYFDKDKAENGRLFKYEINPNDLIDQMMLDPRLTKDEFLRKKAEIEQSTGFNGPIKRSLLYTPPKAMLIGI